MTSKTAARIRSIYICENAFQDKGNKWNIIGMFTGDIIVKKFPVQFPFALYVEAEVNQATDIIVDFYLGSKRVAGVKASADLLKGKEKGVAVVAVPRIEISVNAESELRVTASIGGGASRTLVKKRIKLGELEG